MYITRAYCDIHTHIANTTQLPLSYEARVALWTAHLPSFEQEVCVNVSNKHLCTSYIPFTMVVRIHQ